MGSQGTGNGAELTRLFITHPFSLSIVTYKWFRWCGIAELTWRVECKAKRKADPRYARMTFRRRPTRGESRNGGAGEMQDGLKSASTQLGEHNGGGSAAADGAVEFNLGSLWTG